PHTSRARIRSSRLRALTSRWLAVAVAAVLLLAGTGLSAAQATGASLPDNLKWDNQNPPWPSQLDHGWITTNNPAVHVPAGMPFFFGVDTSQDPVWKWDPNWIAVCIDFMHTDTEIDPTTNDLRDLSSLIPPQWAKQINETLSAGVQLAEANGLQIDLSGTRQALQFPIDKPEAVNYMYSAVWLAQYLFAKYRYNQPVTDLELSQMSAADGFDPTSYMAAINAFISNYNAAPAASAAPIPLGDQAYVMPDDPTVTPFTIVVDPDNSSPGYADYVSVSTANGHISIQKKTAFSGDVKVAFKKLFNTQIDDGNHVLSGIVTQGNGQTKSLLALAGQYDAGFSLSFESPSFAPQGVTLVSSQPVVAG
ncbi:hypothetical protein, partial [Mesorhizobium japonicum]|uniref:hypothetical protein n=1 Tax=Mesorhizobium japonicum TaxID=2066070 RepID=UPI003B5C5EA0